jgi:hypothetical protein
MGEGASVVMAQPAPTFCIQVPILDATEAIQIQRNQVNIRGLHVPRAEEVAEANFYFRARLFFKTEIT